MRPTPPTTSNSNSILLRIIRNPTTKGILIGFALGLSTAQVQNFSQASAAATASSTYHLDQQAESEDELECDCDYWTKHCSSSTGSKPLEDDNDTVRKSYTSSQADKERGLILPFERTYPKKEFLPGKYTDSYTYFHNYLHEFGQASPKSNSPALKEDSLSKDLPMWRSWPKYFEAYHNHFQRFRGRDEVVFMEIGVQSGGKIPLLRDYFGPSLTYIGIDINPSCKMFEDLAENIHIEIGNSNDREFWSTLQKKYPKVDIFLDDGGHFMKQQQLAMEIMLPHLQPDGVYMCEDLSTSWASTFGGIPWGTVADNKNTNGQDFIQNTTMGLVHKTLDWLNAGWIPGGIMKYQLNHKKLQGDTNSGQSGSGGMMWQETPWWKTFHGRVKHIHLYNQIVVYELGYVDEPFDMKTIGKSIPVKASGQHSKVIWKPIFGKIKKYTKSPW